MRKFDYKPRQFSSDAEQSMKDLHGSLSSIANDLDEIKNVFKVQLDKDGNPERAELAEEIIRFCYTNTDMKALIGDIKPGFAHMEESYALMLYDIANIVDAINNKNVDAIDETISALPNDGSNGAIEITRKSLQVSYGLLSDLDKAVCRDLFKMEISKTLGYDMSNYEFDRDVTNFEYLGSLKRYNEETLKFQR